MKEYGAVRRTIHAARYLTDEDRRRRVGRQLNKGEGLHSLRRTLFFAREGTSVTASSTSRSTKPCA